ncbi:TPA: replication protein [Klebsiella aerogenes]|nr:replication protein [Klebsiella aerogenes]
MNRVAKDSGNIETDNVVYLFRRDSVKEVRVADLDDGYARVANELLDAIMASGLSETELCIILAVWRKTYGFGKSSDWISNEQFEQMILKHRTHCSTAKNRLVQKKILIQQGRKVGMNTNISEWEVKFNGFCKTLAEGAKKNVATSAKQAKQKLLTTKEITTQKKKDNSPNPLAVVGAPQEKPKKQKSPPLDYQACLEVYNELAGDRLPHAVELSDERRRKLRLLVKSLLTPTVAGFRAYVSAFMEQARPFHFGENDRQWVANFDYLLRRKVLTAVREGTL